MGTLALVYERSAMSDPALLASTDLGPASRDLCARPVAGASLGLSLATHVLAVHRFSGHPHILAHELSRLCVTLCVAAPGRALILSLPGTTFACFKSASPVHILG